MRVHAVQTGTVAVHERQRAGRGHGVLRFVNTLRDREWTKPLPIYAWAIEHPEGIIIVDTGETARASEPGYFPRWHPYYRWGVRIRVTPEEEIGPQLRALGIAPSDIAWVIMTHLHTDHAGGLQHFPKSRILMSRDEYAAAIGLIGKLRGYLPHRWPEWLSPTFMDFVPEPVGPFPTSFALTRSGDVCVVPTPGHSAGHVSVLARDGTGGALCFAGDASYTERNLVNRVIDGVSSLGGGEEAARLSLERLNLLARAEPLTYLPSHDPDSARRLMRRERVLADVIV